MYILSSKKIILEINNYKKNNNINTRELAKKTGISPVSLSCILTGKTRMIRETTWNRLKAVIPDIENARTATQNSETQTEGIISIIMNDKTLSVEEKGKILEWVGQKQGQEINEIVINDGTRAAFVKMLKILLPHLTIYDSRPEPPPSEERK